MNVLLINPDYPSNLQSMDKILKRLGNKIQQPPLGLLTLAALLPDEWNFEIIELKTREIGENDWDRCDIVMVSGNIVQSRGIYEIIREGKRRGKPVVVGGPYAFNCHQDILDAGADIVVKGEAEPCVLELIEAIENGRSGILIEAKEPADMVESPLPRYDLVDFDRYTTMDVQFSRGCPFQCSFCEITHMLGRKVRTKSPNQILTELQYLYHLGWRGFVQFAEDNFIGNPSRAKALLQELIPWMEERNYPFEFLTQVSLNLAQDPELLDLMVKAGFFCVFIGIETLDEKSLRLTKKTPNIGLDIIQACRTINQAGFRIIASCIIGFDNESSGADKRLIDFATQTDIPEFFIHLLQAVPGTELGQRLEEEGRLRWGYYENTGSEMLSNFVPTRPIDEIVTEFINVYESLYDPGFFIQRTYRHFSKMKRSPIQKSYTPLSRHELLLLAITIFKQGFLYSCRWKFWKYLFKAFVRFQRRRFELFLTLCVLAEHYFEFCKTIRVQMKVELERKRHLLTPD